MVKKIGHLNGIDGRLVALVTRFHARSVERLLDAIGGEHTKDNRHSALVARSCDARGGLMRHMFEVWRFSAHDGSETDNSCVAAGFGEPAGYERNLEAAGYPSNINPLARDAMTFKSRLSAGKKPIGYQLVETRDDNREPSAGSVELAFVAISHG